MASAKRSIKTVGLVVKRDRVEKSYASWQALSERFAAFRAALAGYRGKVLPYVFGVLDVAGLVVLLDRFGVDVNELKTMAGM